MSDFGNLTPALCGAAMMVRGYLDERGFSSVSFKVTALHDGKAINKVGVVGDDDPAKKTQFEQWPDRMGNDNGC
jgi:hypothetical protein